MLLLLQIYGNHTICPLIIYSTPTIRCYILFVSTKTVPHHILQECYFRVPMFWCVSTHICVNFVVTCECEKRWWRAWFCSYHMNRNSLQVLIEDGSDKSLLVLFGVPLLEKTHRLIWALKNEFRTWHMSLKVPDINAHRGIHDSIHECLYVYVSAYVHA